MPPALASFETFSVCKSDRIVQNTDIFLLMMPKRNVPKTLLMAQTFHNCFQFRGKTD